MRDGKEIRNHLEAALALTLQAEHDLLAYFIEMALLEVGNGDVREALASQTTKRSGAAINGPEQGNMQRQAVGGLAAGASTN